ncbi:hypothetical protein [Algoriphagus sp.]|uniref:hypothetical protein n=1 Tax=Algoriphagus sp. TaxID=1872435 RepID=UPI003F72D8B4
MIILNKRPLSSGEGWDEVEKPIANRQEYFGRTGREEIFQRNILALSQLVGQANFTQWD